MALVVLLRGINVGGSRRFRPSALARQLARFDVVNIGAAGTFIVRARVSAARIRAEIRRRLPFATDVIVCADKDVRRLTARDRFAGQPSGAGVLRFVTTLGAPRKRGVPTRFQLPPTGRWGLKVLGCEGRFVIGLHRREMKALSHLARMEKLFGVPMTTRQWSTFLTIRRLLA